MLELEVRLGCVELVETDDGIRLRTWTDGQPTELPPVLLVHGGPGMWDYLEPVARMLETHTVVHRYDQRGCGDRTLPTTTPSPGTSLTSTPSGGTGATTRGW
jgi:pimeloyl-ACP methyl ester carboxylesterase